MTETEAGAHRRLGAVRGRVNAARRAFRRWRRRRPFWGGLLLMLSGLQIFASTQLSLGNIQMRIGLEGMQSIVIPIVVGLAGLLIWYMPAHRVFYGVIGIVVALYSLIGVNLGGFLIGMLLGILGGSFAIAWAPNPEDEAPAHGDDDDSDEPEPDDDPDDIVAIDDLMEDDYPGHPDRGTDRERGRASVQMLVVGGLLAALIASEWVVPAVAGPSAHIPSADASCEELYEDPVARIAGVLGDVVDGILPGDDASPSPSATPTPEPTPSVTSTPPPSPTPDPTSEPSPTPDPSPTAEPSPEPPSEPEPCEPPAEEPPPEGETPTDNEAPSDDGEANEGDTGESDWPLPESEWPDDAEPTDVQVLATPDDLIVGKPSRLTADQLTMYGLRYEGNVCLSQVDGSCVEVMHFTMDTATMVNAKLDSPAYEDGRLVTDMGDLELDGDIHFYTPRFVGWLLGFKWTFLPETPPPFTLPIMPFSDVDIQMAAVITDVMEIAGMQQQPR